MWPRSAAWISVKAWGRGGEGRGEFVYASQKNEWVDKINELIDVLWGVDALVFEKWPGKSDWKQSRRLSIDFPARPYNMYSI